MLDQLLIELENNHETATNILENEYQILYKKIEEEALGMCNLSSGIYDKGRTEGSILKAVKVVQNLLEKNFTLEEALPIADIDKETYEKYVGKEE
jgi:aspartate/tyrosine/aromatic aminotransferase